MAWCRVKMLWKKEDFWKGEEIMEGNGCLERGRNNGREWAIGKVNNGREWAFGRCDIMKERAIWKIRM